MGLNESNYAKWLQDTMATQERSRGRTQALISMSGVREGSDIWNRMLNRSSTESLAELNSLREGYTGSRLQKQFGAYRANAPAPYRGGKGDEEQMTMARSITDIQYRWKEAYGMDLENWEAYALQLSGDVDKRAGKIESATPMEGVFTDVERQDFLDRDLIRYQLPKEASTGRRPEQTGQFDRNKDYYLYAKEPVYDDYTQYSVNISLPF